MTTRRANRFYLAVTTGVSLTLAASCALVGCAVPQSPEGAGGGHQPSPDEQTKPTGSPSSPTAKSSGVAGYPQPTQSSRSSSLSPTKKTRPDLDAEQLLTNMVAFTESASSVRMRTISLGGGTFIRTQETFTNSQNFRYTETSAATGTHEVLRVGKNKYVKGGEKFWLATGEVTEQQVRAKGLDEKWVKVNDLPVENLTVDVFGLFEEGRISLTMLTTVLEVVTEDTCNDVPGYRLESGTKLDFLSLCVARDDNRLLSLTGDSSGLPGETDANLSMHVMFFDAWNSVPPISAPPAQQVLGP